MTCVQFVTSSDRLSSPSCKWDRTGVINMNTRYPVAITCDLLVIYILTIYTAPFENVTNRSSLFFYRSLYDIFAFFLCSVLCISIRDYCQPWTKLGLGVLFIVTLLGSLFSSFSLLLVLKTVYTGGTFTLLHHGKNEHYSVTNRIVLASFILFFSWILSFLFSIAWFSSLVGDQIDEKTQKVSTHQLSDYKMLEAIHGRPPTYKNAVHNETLQ
ncbi:LANO_0B04654g1_1 [Lachancea nothofagi CBS 11611]|uniref:LANO_0B04654g1_1 n=1 Tax=Lachancea nothofagi CBS 11611 TaxID=1266666 RepID=A0A1G4IXT2_9SACH|nr:LANO_0B04654g1_1 [Lachancea nothofagi CBS 11611]